MPSTSRSIRRRPPLLLTELGVESSLATASRQAVQAFAQLEVCASSSAGNVAAHKGCWPYVFFLGVDCQDMLCLALDHAERLICLILAHWLLIEMVE